MIAISFFRNFAGGKGFRAEHDNTGSESFLGLSAHQTTRSFRGKATNVVGMLGLAGFILVTTWAFRPIICYFHPQRENGHWQSSVVSFPQMLCWESPDHGPLVAIGVIGAILGPIAFCALCIHATLGYRTHVAHGDIAFIMSYSFLFSRFHPRCKSMARIR